MPRGITSHFPNPRSMEIFNFKQLKRFKVHLIGKYSQCTITY